MAKLHELLPVASNLRQQASKTRTELQNTFDKKRHLFSQKRITFTPNEENAQPITEEQLDLQSTVKHELAWVAPFIAKAIDAQYHVDRGNMEASGDVQLEDGTVLLGGVPATNLLDLSKRLDELRQFVASVPTLDPSKGFRPDDSQGEGVYVARPVTKTRTKKITKPIVLFPATKEHAAQTQLIAEDTPVGTIQELEWSGLITPAEKGQMIERVDELIRAVKKARSKANEQEVKTDTRIGHRILDYAFKGAK